MGLLAQVPVHVVSSTPPLTCRTLTRLASGIICRRMIVNIDAIMQNLSIIAEQIRSCPANPTIMLSIFCPCRLDDPATVHGTLFAALMKHARTVCTMYLCVFMYLGRLVSGPLSMHNHNFEVTVAALVWPAQLNLYALH